MTRGAPARVRRALPMLAVALPPAALAVELPLRGQRLELRVREPTERSARLVVRDPVIAPPFADPSRGAALILSGGVAPGQCRVEISLDPAVWTAIGGNGARKGYRYRVVDAGRSGRAPGPRALLRSV